MVQPQAQKAFPVSWQEFHRDARALAWRLADAGPFEAIVCVTRGGLVPAAIVARAYVSSVYGRQTGAVIDASGGL